MGIIHVFKKEKKEQHETALAHIHTSLSHAFSKVRQEMHLLFAWIHYFNHRHDQHESNHALSVQRFSEHRSLIQEMDAKIREVEKELASLREDHDTLRRENTLLTEKSSTDPNLNRASTDPGTNLSTNPNLVRIRTSFIDDKRGSEKVKYEPEPGKYGPGYEPESELQYEPEPETYRREKPIEAEEDESEPELPRKKSKVGRMLEEKILQKVRTNKKEYILQQMLKMIEEGSYTTKELELELVQKKGYCGRTAFYSYLKELRDKGHIQRSDSLGDGLILRHAR